MAEVDLGTFEVGETIPVKMTLNGVMLDGNCRVFPRGQPSETYDYDDDLQVGAATGWVDLGGNEYEFRYVTTAATTIVFEMELTTSTHVRREHARALVVDPRRWR